MTTYIMTAIGHVDQSSSLRLRILPLMIIIVKIRTHLEAIAIHCYTDINRLMNLDDLYNSFTFRQINSKIRYNEILGRSFLR